MTHFTVCSNLFGTEFWKRTSERACAMYRILIQRRKYVLLYCTELWRPAKFQMLNGSLYVRNYFYFCVSKPFVCRKKLLIGLHVCIRCVVWLYAGHLLYGGHISRRKLDFYVSENYCLRKRSRQPLVLRELKKWLRYWLSDCLSGSIVMCLSNPQHPNLQSPMTTALLRAR